MIYLIDISKDVLRIVNTPDIIALAARVLLLSIVLCTRVAIFFYFFFDTSKQYMIIYWRHTTTINKEHNMNQYDNNIDIDINEDPNIEMHQQKQLTDDDIDAMYEQHLNDNNNQ